MGIRILGLAMMAVASEPPGFVDAADAITLWLPEASALSDLAERTRFSVAGRRIAVVGVKGRTEEVPSRDPDFLNLPGTLQRALGAKEWDPTGDSTQFVRAGEHWELVVRLPKGHYEYKLARGGSWGENWGRDFTPGGENLALDVPETQLVRFVVQFDRRKLLNSIEHPDRVAKPTSLPERPRRPLAGQFRSVQFRLARPLSAAELTQPLRIAVGAGPVRRVYPREALNALRYEGPLGAAYRPTGTTFAVWSPVAQRVAVEIEGKDWPLRRQARGAWTGTVPGDLRLKRYRYRYQIDGRTTRGADLYGRAATADSAFSVVVAPSDLGAATGASKIKPADAVLYEAHVRDFTISPSSGVKAAWRGKYLGVSESGTTFQGRPTGVNHLKRLGVTHLHLLPFQDINPAHPFDYNWGYETTLFNVPEERYATQRTDPLSAVREVKRMVSNLHRQGLGAVLDVVYNHSMPAEGDGSPFWAAVPYYYFRTDDRGQVLNESGVGNALHDDRPMVRRFIRDSLVYWAREYRLDGFRFDLLGMFTPETVRDLVRTIRAVNPNAILYGEPWTGGGPIRFGKGDQRGTGMGVFNDDFRNLLRGDLDGSRPGFAMGGGASDNALLNALRGSVDSFAQSPGESINYVSAHDNMTLWDRVAKSLPDPTEQARAVEFSAAITLLSQGIPFLEGGIEIGRTKGGNPNSYNAGDAVNAFDWARAARYGSTTDTIRKWIALRRQHSAFRMTDPAMIRRAIKPLQPSGETFLFRIDGRPSGDSWKEILVILNGSRRSQRIELPEGAWTNGLTGQSSASYLNSSPLSAQVLYRS